jgi:hypothetical protein
MQSNCRPQPTIGVIWRGREHAERNRIVKYSLEEHNEGFLAIVADAHHTEEYDTSGDLPEYTQGVTRVTWVTTTIDEITTREDKYKRWAEQSVHAYASNSHIAKMNSNVSHIAKMLLNSNVIYLAPKVTAHESLSSWIDVLNPKVEILKPLTSVENISKDVIGYIQEDSIDNEDEIIDDDEDDDEDEDDDDDDDDE